MVEVDPDESHQARLSSLGDLQWRQRVLRLAITKQRSGVHAAAARASASICETLRPEYQDVIADLAAALLTLADASERERAFREQLIDGGIIFINDLRPMPFRQGGEDAVSAQGAMSMWFKDAVEHDSIDVDQIPEPWRDRWFGDRAPGRS